MDLVVLEFDLRVAAVGLDLATALIPDPGVFDLDRAPQGSADRARVFDTAVVNADAGSRAVGFDDAGGIVLDMRPFKVDLATAIGFDPAGVVDVVAVEVDLRATAVRLDLAVPVPDSGVLDSDRAAPGRADPA